MKKILLFALCFSLVFVVASCNTNTPEPPKGDEWFDKDGEYTYNDFITATTSMNWNPLSWETNDDSYVLGYLSAGFYDYQLNEDATGWEISCEMAAALPVDVTEEYVGQYGVQAGEKGKAWKIALNQDAKWENGTPITSADYIYSMKQQLDPQQLNRRADSYYGGDFSFVNAKNYLYGGSFAYASNVISANYGAEEYYTAAQVTKDAETGQYIVDGEYVGFSLTNGGSWSSNSLSAYYNAGYIVANADDYAVLQAAAGTGYKKLAGWIPATDETVLAIQNVVAELHGYADVEAYAAAAGDYAYQEYQEFCFYGAEMPVLDFEEVGLVAIDDYTIVIVIENELLNPGFYLPYYLSSTWLVNEQLFESCWKQTPDGLQNEYMTSTSTSISYGPYVLSYFEADKQITFTRNRNWYGYYDGKHENQYQTDTISCRVIGDHKTQILAFEQGTIDAVGLDSDDIKKYGGSNYLVYTPESYTTKFTINTDYAALTARETAGINKRILTVKEFREAFSLCMDRSAFTSQFTAAAAPGYGLLNYMYHAILEDGSEACYRNVPAAKEALVNLYGIEYGEGKDYATLDEAYSAITGFDMAKAKEKMQAAYDYAVANNLYTDGETVKVRFSVYQADDIYVQMYEYIKGQLVEACVGTSLEGKVELEMFVDADYYNTLYAGKTDVIFSTWGGATYGALTLLAQCYCDDHTGNGNQMELGFNTDVYFVEFTIDGTTYTNSIKKWADWLNGTVQLEGLQHNSAYSVAVKMDLTAALEEAYLAQFCAIPLYYRQGASLHSQKINYGSNTYINLIGFGGLRHITYNYTDAEWETYRAGGLVY